VHGLVRGENMELGRDSDTGGQVNILIIWEKFLVTNQSFHGRVRLIFESHR